ARRLQCSGAPRDRHPFPTRRSSDLSGRSSETSASIARVVTAEPCVSLKVIRPVFRAPRRRSAPIEASAKTRLPLDDGRRAASRRSEEHTSELQSRENLVCRLLLEKK